MQPILPGWQFHGLEINFAQQPEVEKEVIEKVASYGKQLGILTDALLALTGDAPQKKQARLERLRGIAAEIDKIKAEHKADLAASAKKAMESLAKNDAAAARRIASEYTGQTAFTASSQKAPAR
jgi:oligoendopeptidase F